VTKPTSSDKSRTLGFLLTTCANLLRKRFEQNSQGSGLTLAQWKVLVTLSMNDIEPITIARSLDKLQAMTLVERRPHPSDKRSWLLHLAPAAAEKIELAKIIGDATRAEALVGVSASDLEHLLKTLQQIEQNLGKACAAPPIEQKSRKP
jgi:DNA-binding MarR family transcriptional regulator